LDVNYQMTQNWSDVSSQKIIWWNKCRF
jgi:hypothetical protein